MKKKKIPVLIFVLVYVFTLTGCWNYREIETLLIVAGIAVDKGANGSGYHLTFDTVDVTGGDGPSSPAKSKLIESEGNTIFDAMRNAVKKSDKKLYYGDCRVVIISSQIASEGIAPVLDMFNRDSEPRNDMALFISREETAQDAIKPKGLTNQIASYETNKTVANDSKFLSKAPFVKLYQANDLLAGNGISLALPALDVKNNVEDPATELDGAAIFKRDKLLGYLSGDEAKLFMFITDQINGGLFLVAEDSPEPRIALEIDKSKTHTAPIYTGGHTGIKIDIQMQCALAEVQTATDYDTEDGIKKVENDAADQLEFGIKQLIKKVQKEYDSDIFGFGNTIYQDNFDYWSNIKQKWDSVFSTLNVDVTAKVKIQNAATLKSKVKVGD